MSSHGPPPRLHPARTKASASRSADPFPSRGAPSPLAHIRRPVAPHSLPEPRSPRALSSQSRGSTKYTCMLTCLALPVKRHINQPFCPLAPHHRLHVLSNHLHADTRPRLRLYSPIVPSIPSNRQHHHHSLLLLAAATSHSASAAQRLN
jgi:hypothetical protein